MASNARQIGTYTSPRYCPEGSATFPTMSPTHVCESHDASAGICDQCGQRFGAVATAICTNCLFDIRVGVAAYLGTRTEVMEFLIEHEIDPVAPGEFHPYAAAEETILSRDPFEARYTFTVEDATLTVTVNDDLSVVDVTRAGTTEANWSTGP